MEDCPVKQTWFRPDPNIDILDGDIKDINSQLCKIVSELKRIRLSVEPRSEEVIERLENWEINIINDQYYTASQRLTFDAGTQNLDIIIPFGFQLNRIEQKFNDATARTWSLRINTNPSNTTYAEFANIIAGVSTSSVSVFGNEFIFPHSTQIRLQYSGTTNGKTVDVVIALEKI